jgi:hypothetical protein
MQAERARLIAMEGSVQRTVNCRHEIAHVAVDADSDNDGELNVSAEEN